MREERHLCELDVTQLERGAELDLGRKGLRAVVVKRAHVARDEREGARVACARVAARDDEEEREGAHDVRQQAMRRRAEASDAGRVALGVHNE